MGEMLSLKIQDDLYLLELHNADLLVLEFLGILTEEQIGLGRYDGRDLFTTSDVPSKQTYLGNIADQQRRYVPYDMHQKQLFVPNIRYRVTPGVTREGSYR